MTKIWGTRPLRPSCRFPLYSGSSSRGSWYNLVINSYQIPPERQNHLPPNLSNFMTEHLFQGLCADAPAHCEAYSASPSPITGCKGGFAAGWRGIIEKVAEGEGKGENEREREGGGDGKGNSALVVGDICLCHWGPGRAPAEKKTISCILGFTKHFWLIDNLIFYNSVIQCSRLILPAQGEDFPRCPNFETVCLPSLWKALSTEH